MPLILLLMALPGYSQSFRDPIIGFYPGTSTLPSKRLSNITIAIMLPYKSFWNLTTPNDYANCSICPWMREMDSAAELVVNQINNSSDILPNTMVNIVRVQSWDQRLSVPGDGLGGAAVAALELVSKFPNITAGVLGQFQIPFSGGVQNLPVLSNKNNYPYFFRTTYSASEDVQRFMNANHIIVLSYSSYNGYSTDIDFSQILGELKRVEARYIILCAQGWSNSYSLVVQAKNMNLISPNHVWFVTNPPYPQDYSGVGDEPRLDILHGMVYPNYNFALPTDPNSIEIARLLKDRKDITVDQLNDGSLKHLMTHKLFANTSFKGISLNPMLLDSNGDVAADTVFLTLNATFWIQAFQAGFGQVNKLTGEYKSLADPIFYGGGTIPPPDGPPATLLFPFVLTFGTYQGQILITLISIGYMITIGSLVFILHQRKNSAIKLLNIPCATASLIGSFLSVTCTMFFIGLPTDRSCNLKVWFGLMGFTLMTVPIIIRNLYLWVVMNLRTTKKNFIKRLKLVAICFGTVLSLVPAVLLCYWTNEHSYSLNSFVYRDMILYDCGLSHSKSVFASLLVAYETLLTLGLLICAYIGRNVSIKYNESTLLLFLSAITALLAIALTQMGVDESSPLKESICIWIVSQIIPVVQIGSRALEIFRNHNLRDLLISRTSQNQRTNSNQPKGGKSKISLANLSLNFTKRVTPMAYLTNIPTVMCYKLKSKSMIIDPIWRVVHNVAICHLHKKSWVLLGAPVSLYEDEIVYQCFPLENSTFEVKGTLVSVFTPPNDKWKEEGHVFRGCELRCEFGDETEAISFVNQMKEGSTNNATQIASASVSMN
ncbi:periplasmic binding protein-like I [Rhizoclosmatium globosum]|uniref:Periplasmic binding protein-like I n=1 Tax=Rhizoclosmatium globosum TaxID=329046 RepID=A0A1Y2CBU8_9FUNG|nr:periplasmic binding protein-like I [Rhizoclosmatium globosum]|eukprot:ORY44513.1 periplasmic binding protein-like I [Rhizoclosmatium globosum]